MVDGRVTHGMSNTPEHRAWVGMFQRCYNLNNCRYDNYGGRDIAVCARWNDFELFYMDMGNKPSSDY